MDQAQLELLKSRQDRNVVLENRILFLLQILSTIRDSKTLQTDAQIKAFVNSELIKYFGEYYE